MRKAYGKYLTALLLHETMTPLQIAGAALIIGGAVYGEWRPAGKARKKART